jgi:hypothetical protein
MNIAPIVTWVFLAIVLIVSWFVFRGMKKKDAEVNRAADDLIQRKADADRQRQIYEDDYQREGRLLKDRVLAELKAVARGDKRSFGPEALNAVKALQTRQGEHPETVAAWAPVLQALNGEIHDPREMQFRLGDLLYPETLENTETLKRQVSDDLEKVTGGVKSRLDPETLEAANALNGIKARDDRIRRQERE